MFESAARFFHHGTHGPCPLREMDPGACGGRTIPNYHVRQPDAQITPFACCAVAHRQSACCRQRLGRISTAHLACDVTTAPGATSVGMVAAGTVRQTPATGGAARRGGTEAASGGTTAAGRRAGRGAEARSGGTRRHRRRGGSGTGTGRSCRRRRRTASPASGAFCPAQFEPCCMQCASSSKAHAGSRPRGTAVQSPVSAEHDWIPCVAMQHVRDDTATGLP